MRKNERWTARNIPSQEGRRIVITGTGGLGFECALELAKAGGEVIIAGRNPEKGAAAVERIRGEVSSANVEFEQLDLASLKSVAEFSSRLGRQRDSLDTLINNAGVMVPPKRLETTDGFELQFGTNYLGHFALTAGLLPLLKNGTNPRVVSVSSVAARGGAIDFEDLQAEKNYKPFPVYSQSKLACLMFALELHRRSQAGGWGIDSIAAHPGVSRTDLLHNGPGRWSPMGLSRSLMWFLFQPATQGALPTLFAAASPDAVPGGYFGPHKFGETRGFPVPAEIPEKAKDDAVASRLWEVSESFTEAIAGLAFPPLATASA